jgi:hypothetical protein
MKRRMGTEGSPPASRYALIRSPRGQHGFAVASVSVGLLIGLSACSSPSGSPSAAPQPTVSPAPIAVAPVVVAPVVAPAVVAPVVIAPVVIAPVVVAPATVSPTTQDVSQWTIAIRTTLPYAVAPSAQLPISGRLVLDRLVVPQPANWLVLQSGDDVAAAISLNEQLRSSMTSSFLTDPSRAFFVPNDEQTSATATTVLVIVRPKSAVGAEDAFARLIERAQQNEGLKIISKGRSDWLDGRAHGAVLQAADGRLRCIRIVRLKDQRLVMLQADGSRPDLQAIHAQFGELMVQSVEPSA